MSDQTPSGQQESIPMKTFPDPRLTAADFAAGDAADFAAGDAAWAAAYQRMADRLVRLIGEAA